MEKINYEQAIEELETIVSKMESGELNLDAITEKLKRAQKLIKLCKDRLTKTDEEIKKILSSDN
ncbi:MAG: exodeoxyribonuclease VII small subunit [bacterium]|nr:exodeoxyribonuclease VII small subunit [Hoylesella loescheii]MCI6476845.1 exodeoxyribonuclease VII small subunit [Bacteroidales bacterium]MDO4208885.1 exodeoxyribonuclease VII small subunit [bacterium]MDY3355706.1 exodeoxyribonuclease VII small subunit [Prevotella sp.]MCI6724580.1 exodeoxyribonuclease VII small subunit [Bacteroidales bacterium]